MGTSREVGVNLKEGYNGDLTSREAGSVGGQMVKKMIESYEKSLHLPLDSKRTGPIGPVPACRKSLFDELIKISELLKSSEIY